MWGTMMCSFLPPCRLFLLLACIYVPTEPSNTGIMNSNEWCFRYPDCSSCVAYEYSLPSFARTSSLRESGADEASIQRMLSEERCGWDLLANKCVDMKLDAGGRYISEMAECRAHSEVPDDANILPSWMGTLINMTQSNNSDASGPHRSGFSNLTLSDISLPGTHDTLSYDLSLEISDDGLERFDKVDRLLHAFSGGTIQLLPGELEGFLRDQSKTQRLNITEQLNGGVRFLDIRITMEQEGHVWYGVHFMQTERPVMDYLVQIKEWLDDHPKEIIVIWLSHHGVPGAFGEDQYPGASREDKDLFWASFCRLFEGLLIDTTVSQFNSTTIGKLIERSHRVVTFATDYVEFTNSSRFAIDGSNINNWVRGEGAFDETITLDLQRGYFQEAPILNRWAQTNGKFTLMGMNTEGTEDQILGAAKDRFLARSLFQEQLLNLLRSLLAHLSQFVGILGEAGGLVSSIIASQYLDNCPKNVNIPGVKTWCPSSLLEIGQLSSYYDQIAIEEAFLFSFISPDLYAGDTPKAAFPNAFYLDSLDVSGTIRTGSGLASLTDEDDENHEYSRYAYIDTVIAYNAELACRITSDGDSHCRELRRLVAQRRQRFPIQRWEDREHGRLVDWPHYKY